MRMNYMTSIRTLSLGPFYLRTRECKAVITVVSPNSSLMGQDKDQLPSIVVTSTLKVLDRKSQFQSENYNMVS